MKNLAKKIIKKLGYEIHRIDTYVEFPIDFNKTDIEIIKSVKPFTLTSIERRFALIQAVNYIIKNKIAGDIVECGVWKGGSIMVITKTLLELKIYDKESYTTNKKILWNLLGGELAVWKDFPEALRILKELDPTNEIRWQTNGSRTLRWWQKNAHLMDNVLISYHPEQADYKHITEVINTLIEADVRYVGLNVCMYPPLKDLCIEAAKYFKQNAKNDCINIKPLQFELGKEETYVYEQEVLDMMKYYSTIVPDLYQKRLEEDIDYRFNDNKMRMNRGFQPESMYWVNTTTGERELVLGRAYELMTDGTNSWRGWSCNIGIEKLNIMASGRVTSGSSCNFHIDHGNINQSNAIEFPETPIVCNYDFCPCASDIAITKSKVKQ